MSKRPDLHSEAGVEIYSQGMDKSAEDKYKAIVPLMVGGPTLEIGCGSGSFLSFAAQRQLGEYTGVDFSGRLLDIASRRDYGNSRVRLHRADAFGMIDKEDYLESPRIPTSFYSNLIFCSFLHEVQERCSNDFNSIMEFALKLGGKYLRANGVVIIRDGCKQDDWRIRVEFKTEFARQRFFMFADDYTNQFFDFEVDPMGGSVVVNKRNMYEFATKYFYTDNWDVEVAETFGWGNPELLSKYDRCRQYQRDTSGRDFNFKLLSASSYTIPFLKDKWDSDFTMYDCSTGQRISFDSTMIACFRKEHNGGNVNECQCVCGCSR